MAENHPFDPKVESSSGAFAGLASSHTRLSPVRASAQEQAQQRKVASEAKTLWLAIARAEQEVFEDELTYVSIAPIIIAALTAAEARGRQQAEQARDELQQERLRQVHIFSTELFAEQQRVAALTQALKDIATWQGQIVPVLNDEYLLASDVRKFVERALNGL